MVNILSISTKQQERLIFQTNVYHLTNNLPLFYPLTTQYFYLDQNKYIRSTTYIIPKIYKNSIKIPKGQKPYIKEGQEIKLTIEK